MFPFKVKSRLPLPTYVIHYILMQMVAITFICVMILLNLFNYELDWLSSSILTFTISATLIYEVIINLWFYGKIKRRLQNTPTHIVDAEDDGNDRQEGNERKDYQEKYLWFLFMLLVDIFLIIYIVTSYTRVDVFLSLVVGILVFYIVSMVVRPYFGVDGMLCEKKESKRKQKIRK